LWGIGGLLALALALRLTALDRGLSFDEIDTLVHYARRPMREVVSTFDSQNQHLLYSVLARISVAALDEGAWAVRLPAAVLGVLSILALHRFAVLVTDSREAVFAAALMAVSYHHVWFSQVARGYTGLLLFTLVGSNLFLKILADPSPRGFSRPFAYGLAMALASATHATGALVVAAHGIVWLARLRATRGRAVGPNAWQPALGLAFATTLSLLFYALVLPQFFHTLLAPTMPGAATEWKRPSWLVMETLRGLARGVPGGAFTIAGALVVALLGLRSYFRQSRALFGLFALPTAITAAALLVTGHNLWPRMFFSSAGFYVLIALRGVTEWARIFSLGQLAGLMRKMATAALALLCLMSAAKTFEQAWLPKQDFEAARDRVEASRGATDAVATLDMTVMPYAELHRTSWTPVATLAELEELEAAHPRTWIVYTSPTRLASAYPAIWRHVQERYRQVAVFPGTLGGGEIYVAVTGDPVPEEPR
jgi:hypothetical protein